MDRQAEKRRQWRIVLTLIVVTVILNTAANAPEWWMQRKAERETDVIVEKLRAALPRPCALQDVTNAAAAQGLAPSPGFSGDEPTVVVIRPLHQGSFATDPKMLWLNIHVNDGEASFHPTIFQHLIGGAAPTAWLVDTAKVLLSLAWVTLFVVWYTDPRGTRRRRRKAAGQCLDCGFDLRGEFDAGCPECGWKRA